MAEAAVVNKLPFPPAVSAEDIVDRFDELLLVRDEAFSAAYDSFVSSILRRIDDRLAFLPVPVAGICGDLHDMLGGLIMEHTDDDEALWFMPNGRLVWWYSGPPVDAVEWDGAYPSIAYVAFAGEGTDAAVKS